MKTIIERGASWTIDETKLLLGLWGQDLLQRQATKAKRTREVYEKMSERFNQSGFERTAEQVRTRVFNMIAEYRRILKDPNREERAKRCMFFEALHKIYQARHMDDIKSALDDYEPDISFSPASNTISSEKGDESISDSEATDCNETINNTAANASSSNSNSASSTSHINTSNNTNNNTSTSNTTTSSCNNNNNTNNNTNNDNYGDSNNNNNADKESSSTMNSTSSASKRIKLGSPKAAPSSASNPSSGSTSSSTNSSAATATSSSNSNATSNSTSDTNASSKQKSSTTPIFATTLGGPAGVAQASNSTSSSSSSTSQRHQSLLLPHAAGSSASGAASTPMSKIPTSAGTTSTPSYININSAKLPIIRTNQLIGHSNGNESLNLNGTATRLPTTAITSHQLYQAPVNTFDVTSSALLIDRMFAHLSRESENMREWIALEKERLALERARRQQETEREVRRERVLIDTLMRFQEQWLSFLMRLNPQLLENASEPPPELKIPKESTSTSNTTSIQNESSQQQTPDATTTTNPNTNSTKDSNSSNPSEISK